MELLYQSNLTLNPMCVNHIQNCDTKNNEINNNSDTMEYTAYTVLEKVNKCPLSTPFLFLKTK